MQRVLTKDEGFIRVTRSGKEPTTTGRDMLA